MRAHRMNITIPKAYFELIKNKPNKSAYIAEALREKLETEEKTMKEKALAQAYRDSAREDAKITEDWDSLSGESL